MNNLKNRRQFLAQSGKASLGVIAAFGAAPLLTACGTAGKMVKTAGNTGFQQTPLPYSYSALNEAIDAQTMELHFTKHAATYATNLQDAAKAEGVDMSKPLEDALRNVSKYSAKLRNNGGGHYNHELFWKIMSPNGGGTPKGALASAIDSSFGSFETFKTQFTDASKNRFGSGWAWLVLDGDKKLRIGSTPNQDNPLMNVAEFKGYPIMSLDVWEHAYYLRYQNKRPDYIAAWWKVVNWDAVQQRFESAV